MRREFDSWHQNLPAELAVDLSGEDQDQAFLPHILQLQFVYPHHLSFLLAYYLLVCNFTPCQYFYIARSSLEASIQQIAKPMPSPAPHNAPASKLRNLW